MRLALYRATRNGKEPTYVSIQDPQLTQLPTILVCPMQRKLEWNVFRAKVEWNDATYTVATDLARPVRRSGLVPMGEVSEEPSRAVLRAFESLLARDF